MANNENKVNIASISTEGRNENTDKIDEVSSIEIARIINNEDKKVAEAVSTKLNEIGLVIDKVTESFRNGGRLIYIGAGTSGRLGVLDASECPPTFGVDGSMVVGIIAGGDTALRNPIEGAEDDPNLCVSDLKKINLSNKDVLIGIAASGRTPYVIGGLEYANSIGVYTVAVCNSLNSAMSKIAKTTIDVVVGGEVITGSTRMKSGTAQKMVLNMITTGAMVNIGKVYGNLMVDVKPSNHKLIERQKNIIMQATGCKYEQAEAILPKAENNCKLAILMLLAGIDNVSEAKKVLDKAQGKLKTALKK